MRKMHCQLAVLMAKKDPRLSQRDLARKLSLSHTTINKLYNGRPFSGVLKSDTINKICDYFQCEIGDLFTMEADVAVDE